MLGIIGGSALARLASLEVSRRQVVRTPYGEPSGALTFGMMGGREVVFLARHGYGQNIPPHEVNYRANIWALHAQGVKNLVGIAAVGGIGECYPPGTLVIPDQIIDYTYGRAHTLFTRADHGVQHIDFTLPYCSTLRLACIEAARSAGIEVSAAGVYAVTQGPRLESAAEINRLERDGGDIVGMTGMPEAAIARELGICYATLALVTNHAAGRGASAHGIALKDMAAFVEPGVGKIELILGKLVTDDGD